MNQREFFNRLAPIWDEITKHDEKKIDKILKLIDIKDNLNILDVGCGTGILESFLLKYNPNSITAVDISEKMIDVAKSKYNYSKINFIAQDIMEHKGLYDLIIIYSAYPHFSDKNALINHLSNMLNKGGKLVVAHSDSREKINSVHSRHQEVKEDRLPPAIETANIFSKYLYVNLVIDNDEMYIVSGIK
ncbi:class I SAM-dependent DNA methyltransferase [Caloramator proteoclasticus]|uniref:Demethylmenaquinone methyltransferase / 2-methoxy-6-polyprenyl-1,4-benzoquinol methylase n=1 Tax=Caloramator proteoclasticus DSM 10124 TaxID=1121262 RepID=A0A1M4XXX1_9CLOT|nr:class I SAM-dependent methyltransferase [Caloramator proteoclasticus]SHE98186.1 demethylmenaquinone methyltransferase / 2-methoxy-6-polyprenyl-1,4-benzoquinol methylase [Caloramator proteoclasticus DSM 10124]